MKEWGTSKQWEGWLEIKRPCDLNLSNCTVSTVVGSRCFFVVGGFL